MYDDRVASYATLSMKRFFFPLIHLISVKILKRSKQQLPGVIRYCFYVFLGRVFRPLLVR